MAARLVGWRRQRHCLCKGDHQVSMRFREWGTEDWTYIRASGELASMVLGAIGSALSRFHCQLLIDGQWETL